MAENVKNYAPVSDGEHFAHPIWFGVDVNPKSGNLNLSVRWAVCNEDGTKIESPEGFDGFETVSATYTIAYGEECDTLKKCAGKPLDFLADVAPKTHKSIKSILSWCPAWDGSDPFWFCSPDAAFKDLVVRVKVVHEEWEGKMYAKAKFTNQKDREIKYATPTIGIEDIQSRFGKFFRASATKRHAAKTEASAVPSAPVAPAAPSPSPAPAPAPASKPMTATKTDCWRAYCEKFGNAAGTDRWYDFTAKIGKDEADFTAEDWGRVFEDITFSI